MLVVIPSEPKFQGAGPSNKLCPMKMHHLQCSQLIFDSNGNDSIQYGDLD